MKPTLLFVHIEDDYVHRKRSQLIGKLIRRNKRTFLSHIDIYIIKIKNSNYKIKLKFSPSELSIAFSAFNKFCFYNQKLRTFLKLCICLEKIELQGKKSVVEEMQQELSRLKEETEFLKNQSAKLSSFGKVAASLDWDLNLGIKIICFRNGWFSTERNNIFKTCRGGDRGEWGVTLLPPLH
ncbi:hypothetical protein BpHYR1_049257 [Brachionus plicatilis]|uniref:Uncharacterized protein n=1 Tax=Brachionus plicatilis TaxID=10195 RepID=A0A3M7PXP4_BRAPC|nr:hypothetical protein BpHYR1_049257 [Brachionus plicatilis]